MEENTLITPIELTDAELDLVTGGQVVTGGLVNVTLSNVSILNHNYTNVTVKDIANNLDLKVGAVIQLLGGPAAIRQLA
ncbi:MAG: hypothetical protein JO162_16155 [Alphaproteobacteria bacterium]|nr:hypothetical protein [Alphaproteobacteria bacterium]MBV9016987.1 hypothetical protein [Alphaproteobacteria bacterium]